MAFDPTKFQGRSTKEKAMPVVLLLDVSGSMSGEKIDRLHDSVEMMVADFVHQAVKEINVKVAAITFGDQVECLWRYTDVKDLEGKGVPHFNASGSTPLGRALCMAKDMIEDKDETKGYWYKPAIILVSDGYPNDDYERPMADFINNGRSAKAQRIAMGIGVDYDRDMLRGFVSSDEFLFQAENASDIAAKFKLITMSVSQRRVSGNPNDFPGADQVGSQHTSRRAASVQDSSDDDDDYK